MVVVVAVVCRLFSVVFAVGISSSFDEGNNCCGEIVSIVVAVVVIIVEVVVVVVEVVDWFVVEVVVGRGVGSSRSTCSTSRGSSRSRSCLYPVKMRSVYHV